MSIIGKFKSLFGDPSQKFINGSKDIVKSINDLEESISKLTDEELKKKTEEFKKLIKEENKTLDDILPEAFSVVREVSKRTRGQIHYDVQLVGGYAMHKGNIAEMRTGEGKTLVATLPAYLNALTGEGVHVITVNDFLARRDATWMGQIYDFLGLSVSVINSQNISYMYDSSANATKDEERDEVGSYKIVYDFLRPCTRKEAYEADIVYGTNNEFGFDYLRDNLATSVYGIVQRGHNYAIVDEIDSILIDEARTPLIISSQSREGEGLYVRFAQIANQLKEGEHYEKDEKLRAITLNDEGISLAEKLLGIKNIYTEEGIKLVHHLETAVRAKALFNKDKEYVVKDGQVIIVDQSTGRMMEGRRFNQGLHQALEAKEGVQIKEESKTIASITYQNYFKMYKKLSGMTGTAKTSQEEFFTVYGLDVISIPTNKPIARIDEEDLILQSEQGKFKAIAKRVKELHDKGQPVLIGTISIEKNELLSTYLKQEGIPHQILNAKKHEEEGGVIAFAGKKGAVTISTNMAGRGVDIKLGGEDATKEEYEEIKSLGGLFVLGTERHESRRIDNQLRGRAGRQGDPGHTQFFVSLEDDLMRVFGGDRLKGMMGRFGIGEDEPLKNSLVSKGIENAQKKIEGFHFDSRKHTLEYDNVLNTQRKSVYDRRRKMLMAEREDVKEYLYSIVDNKEELEKVINEKVEEVGEDTFWGIVRKIVLNVTDVLWSQHLETMDHVRSSVNLRAYGQRDPLIEYKKEGLTLFKQMEQTVKNECLNLIEAIKKPEAGFVDNEKEKPMLGNIDTSKIGRNDKVVVQKGDEIEEIKWKKAEKMIEEGWVLKEVKQ